MLRENIVYSFTLVLFWLAQLMTRTSLAEPGPQAGLHIEAGQWGKLQSWMHGFLRGTIYYLVSSIRREDKARILFSVFIQWTYFIGNQYSHIDYIDDIVHEYLLLGHCIGTNFNWWRCYKLVRDMTIDFVSSALSELYCRSVCCTCRPQYIYPRYSAT